MVTMTARTNLYALLAEMGLKGPPGTIDTLAEVIAKASPKPGTLTFGQAERVGVALHDRWEKMTGEAPLKRDDLAWGDVVQFVIRTAQEVIGSGVSPTSSVQEANP
jgi:hypothetical protein